VRIKADDLDHRPIVTGMTGEKFFNECGRPRADPILIEDFSEDGSDQKEDPEEDPSKTSEVHPISPLLAWGV